MSTAFHSPRRTLVEISTSVFIVASMQCLGDVLAKSFGNVLRVRHALESGAHHGLTLGIVTAPLVDLRHDVMASGATEFVNHQQPVGEKFVSLAARIVECDTVLAKEAAIVLQPPGHIVEVERRMLLKCDNS